ncbi:hypothetical protein QOZ80_4BG0338260 [Eleusine coracana subsp. coracana]|nr:hypothetical protein QOZ80_4BG0338260 [Eleusine coracana subsp. coracana]
MYAPFPSWSPYPAAALAAHSWAAPGDAWIQSVPGTGGAHGFASLLQARNVTSELFENVPAAASNMAYAQTSLAGRYTSTGASPIRPEIAASALGSERPMESACGSFSGHRSTQEFKSSYGKQRGVPPEVAIGGSGSGAGSVPTRRRKSEDRAGGNTKKSRKEASKTSSPPPKMTQPQEPKVDLGERIAALQQIVSPFGKTDRASVLSETIKYINFLHEQIQLFSEPYMTKSLYKGCIQSGGEEEKTGTAHELRTRLSRGLCLVPVPWASQVCRDDTLPDCWTPAYRS